MPLRLTDGRFPRYMLLTLVALGLTACGRSKVVEKVDGTEVIEYPADATSRYARALSYMDAGQDARATEEFERIVVAYPDYAGPYVNLGIIHQRNGRPDAARLALDRAVAICSECAVVYNQLGILQRREGQFIEAEKSYLAAIDADPDYALAYFNLGVLYDLYRGRPDLALQNYEAYKTHQPPGAADSKDVVDTWIIDLRRRVGSPQTTAEILE